LSDVKWIKITTNIFDDEKIKIIDSYPARDEIIVIWFKLLTLAGKVNKDGCLFLSDKIPYTTDMLSSVFNREKKSIELALSTFEKLGMVNIEQNNIINITNWKKHQNVEGLEKIRENNRLRVARHREQKKKQIECNVTSNVTVTPSNGAEIEKELEKEKEKETNLLSEFEKFWNLYDKKVDKKATFKKWKKLKQEDKDKIFKTLPEYVKSTPDVKFRKNPVTYLNNESWKDEIVYRENKNKQPNKTNIFDCL
jgi:predicted phage replisome organizer